MADCRPGQSAWSLSTKPRSTPCRRRAPRSCIQPLAKASLASPRRLAHALPCTAGGAIASVGATSAVLLALGTSGSQAVNFSLAAGMLLTGCALVAAVAGITGSVFLTLRRRHAALAIG